MINHVENHYQSISDMGVLVLPEGLRVGFLELVVFGVGFGHRLMRITLPVISLDGLKCMIMHILGL